MDAIEQDQTKRCGDSGWTTLPFNTLESDTFDAELGFSARKREECLECERPKDQCMCAAIINPPLNLCTRVWILTHPCELRNPAIKRTGRFVQKSLCKCKTLVGRDFSVFPELVACLKTEDCFLLFPGKNAMPLEKYLCEQNEYAYTQHENGVNLIIIDATWRFAREIAFKNNQLLAKAKLVMLTSFKGKFAVRRPPKDGYVSTLEAVVAALSLLENLDSATQEKLLAPMYLAIEQWEQYSTN
mmetsp:Transcript_6028/g.7610  ORF Transcript_6028/g.7610 Transcript_6028/m.7610 type:complete len:243 (-) Transcript_6028:1126-1854(-)